MTRRTGKKLLVTGATALAVLAFLPPSPTPSFAQERPRNLFEFLFSPRRAQPERPPEIKNQRSKKATTKPRVKKKRSSEAAAAADAATPAVEKIAEAKVVLVIGDFVGDGLAEGLEEAYIANPSVRVVDKTNGSSGIVRDDFYDWTTNAPGIIDAEKPAVVVVMMGTNDRQEMRVDGNREPVRSAGWSKAYEARVAAIAKSIRDKNVPLVWVGLPPFRQNSMSADLLAFNDVYRSETEEAGGSFVDIWDGFVDENGAYVTSGPDIKGNPVRLRSGDNGLTFTSAAKRKIAFYVEKPLERILGIQAGQPLIGAAGTTSPLAQPAVIDPANMDRTNPIALTDPALDGGDQLLGASFAPASDTKTPAQKLTVDGVAPPAITGRADDFGNGEPPKAASAAPPSPQTPSPEQTTAIPPKPRG